MSLNDKGKSSINDNEQSTPQENSTETSLPGAIVNGLSSLIGGNEKAAQISRLQGQTVNWDNVFDEVAKVSSGQANSTSYQNEFRSKSFNSPFSNPDLAYNEFKTLSVMTKDASSSIPTITSSLVFESPAFPFTQNQPRDGQAVIDLLSRPDLHSLIDNLEHEPFESSTDRLIRTMEHANDRNFIVDSTHTPYLYHLFQQDGDEFISYLQNTSYTEEVWSLPSPMRRLIEEARQETITGNLQAAAVKRLQLLKNHLLKNDMTLTYDEMEHIWKSF